MRPGVNHTEIRCNREMQTRVQSEDPPDVFTYDTGPGFGGVLADAGLLYPLEKAYEQKGWDIYDWAKQRADRKSTRLNSSHANISYAVFCLKKKNTLRLGSFI